MQRVQYDKDGIRRFVPNPIVEYLLKHGGINLNELACKGFDNEDFEQFAQLIGYSVSGFGGLSYVSDEAFRMASTCRTLEAK